MDRHVPTNVSEDMLNNADETRFANSINPALSLGGNFPTINNDLDQANYEIKLHDGNEEQSDTLANFIDVIGDSPPRSMQNRIGIAFEKGLATFMRYLLKGVANNRGNDTEINVVRASIRVPVRNKGSQSSKSGTEREILRNCGDMRYLHECSVAGYANNEHLRVIIQPELVCMTGKLPGAPKWLSEDELASMVFWESLTPYFILACILHNCAKENPMAVFGEDRGRASSILL